MSATSKVSHEAEMRDFLQWREGDAIILGEANVMPAENKEFFGDEGDRVHMMFNFYVNQGGLAIGYSCNYKW